MPEVGGQYAYLRDAYLPMVAFLYGWVLLLVIQTGGMATVSITFARYFLELTGMHMQDWVVAIRCAGCPPADQLPHCRRPADLNAKAIHGDENYCHCSIGDWWKLTLTERHMTTTTTVTDRTPVVIVICVWYGHGAGIVYVWRMADGKLHRS